MSSSQDSHLFEESKFKFPKVNDHFRNFFVIFESCKGITGSAIQELGNALKYLTALVEVTLAFSGYKRIKDWSRV